MTKKKDISPVKMIKPNWLIEDYEQNGTLNPLIKELKRKNINVKIIKRKIWEKVELNQFPEEDCVVFYGTLNLGRQIQKTKKWIPGVYCNFENFCCNTYYSYWAKYLLNEDYIMLPITEIKRKKDYIFSNFGINDSIFIRPNSGAKTFTGQIIKKENIDKEFKLLEEYAGKSLDKIIAVISSPKKIEKEWRCVVVDKKIIAFSQYIKKNKIKIKKTIDKKALSLAQKIAKEEWEPDRAYTLDICKWNKEYYLLEANSFSCSGLYKCDPKSIVYKISKIALKEWKEYNEQY